MKRFLKLAMISLLMFSFLVPYTAFAETNEAGVEWQDIELSEEEFNALFESNPDNAISAYATGLILSCGISVSKSGNNLVIIAKTTCIPDVSKCGLSKLAVQVRKNSSSDWITYVTYSNLYVEDYIYILSKTIPVPEGYQCRATCTHYAKKNILSTQKVDKVSQIV